MPSWEEYKAASKSRGSLAMELFVVESTASAPAEQMQAVLPAHLDYQKQVEAAGNLFLAGPLSDDTGELMQGTGMIVYRAANLDEAKAIADADPMHAQNMRTYKIRKWLVNEGSLQFSIALSGQKVTMG
ncbi:YciI family protein [Pseudahrensia aquimaris]|uniref:YciI family protein n=1 Tax=Pseudahrensia aquimaris TaxID=744461 RepID=A0ABW3F8T1_9HYPH